MAEGKMPEGIRTTIYWAIGLGIVALILLVLLILFGNLSGDLGYGTNSTTVTNESITFTDGGTTIAAGALAINPSLGDVIVINSTGNETVTSDNYTLSGAVITANETSSYNGSTVKVTYTLKEDDVQKIRKDSVIGNMTNSATNISSQFPTVGTIIGIAILLVILIGVLAFAVRKMLGVAGGSNSGSMLSGGGSKKFKGGSQDFG